MSLLTVAVSTGFAAAASSLPVNKFPPRLYPPPRFFPDWGLPIGCPSLRGVATVRVAPIQRLLLIVGRRGRVSLAYDLRRSDRALWRVVKADWRGRRPARAVRLTPRDVVFAPAAKAPYADLVGNNCGNSTLAKSWWIAVCPRIPRRSRPCSLEEAPATTTHLLFIRRHGFWLNWFIYP